MNRLIQDLLNVARMDTGNLAIDPAPCAPAQLIANAIELMQPLAVEKNLALVDETGMGGMAGMGSMGGAPVLDGAAGASDVAVEPDAAERASANRAGESATVDLPLVNVDAERIGQVFSNLIGNAIKFTPAGGKITLRADASDGRVWFSVTDTGPGIPPEQVEHVFGEFWQARSTDRRGIGLGLTIAKGIVEAHGGVMGVSSEVGVGTRFWFGI
jgi:signal transduction histidine kinase